MSFEQKIRELIEQSVARNPDLFILDLDIGSERNVSLVIDGYRPVPLSECVRISREVENAMETEEEDYALTVSTFDISRWFSDRRQFPKNIGRRLQVQTPEGTHEGQLVEIDDAGIVLEQKVREPKPVGKGKHTVTKRIEIPYEQITKAKVKLQF